MIFKSAQSISFWIAPSSSPVWQSPQVQGEIFSGKNVCVAYAKHMLQMRRVAYASYFAKNVQGGSLDPCR